MLFKFIENNNNFMKNILMISDRNFCSFIQTAQNSVVPLESKNPIQFLQCKKNKIILWITPGKIPYIDNFIYIRINYITA